MLTFTSLLRYYSQPLSNKKPFRFRALRRIHLYFISFTEFFGTRPPECLVNELCALSTFVTFSLPCVKIPYSLEKTIIAVVLRSGCNTNESWVRWPHSVSILTDKAKALLITKGVGDALTDKESEQSEKALALMCLCVSNEYVDLVANSDSAQHAWAMLEDMHAGQTAARRLTLRKELTGLAKKPKESMMNYIMRGKQICTDVRAIDGSVTQMKEAHVRVRDVRGFSTFVLLFQQPNGGWISLRTRVSITRRGILRIYSGVLLGDVTLV